MLGVGRKGALRLTAAKSSVGHAEPAAGGIGVAHVMFMMSHHSTIGLTHLRNINPIILGALKLDIHEPLSLPKQLAPFITLKSRVQETKIVHGISSFAFQGTNAHIVLSMRGFGHGNCAPPLLQQDVLWILKRHWYVGPSHQLLSAVACVGLQDQCTFEAVASRTSLGKATLYELDGPLVFCNVSYHTASRKDRACSDSANGEEALGFVQGT